jgi:hypothetical protein
MRRSYRPCPPTSTPTKRATIMSISDLSLILALAALAISFATLFIR